MIICRITNNEYLQVAYLDDNGIISPEVLQVKVSPRELVNIESFLTRGLKMSEVTFDVDAHYDVDVMAEGQYCMCLYHATKKAVITIRGETIQLHFSLISDLAEGVSKLVSSSV
jgi:hypothetical protein